MWSCPQRIVSPYDCNATVERDKDGRLWVSYSELIGNKAKVSLYFSDDNGVTWISGVTTIKNVESSSSSVISAGGDTGMVVTTSEGVYWVTMSFAGEFKRIELSDVGVAGYYASHYSHVVYKNDIYLGIITPKGHLELYIYDSSTNKWAEPTKPVGKDVEMTSIQFSASDDGTLYMIYDDQNIDKISILESHDKGATWSLVVNVSIPENAVSDPLRFETAEQFTDDLILMVQVAAVNVDDVDGLYEIAIDVDGDGLEIGKGLSAVVTEDQYSVFDL